MPASILARFWLLFGLLLGAAQPTWAQVPAAPAAADLLELPGGAVYEALLDGPQAAVWIAAKPKDPAAALSVFPRPLDVSVGNRHDLALVQAFQVRWHGEPAAEPPTDALSLGIALQIDASRLPAPGTYDVALGFVHKTSGARQTVRVQISVPPAVLRARSALVVERTLPWYSGAARQVAHPLIVAETGGKSYAALTQAVSVISESPQVATVDASIQVAEKQTVPRGGLLSLHVDTRGDFPLGTVKGWLDLQSAQLGATTSVPFEIRTRRDRRLIVLLILLGLAIGLGTRTVLSTRIAVGEQLVKLATLREQLIDHAKQQVDATTRHRLRALVQRLDEAQRLADPQQISARIAEVEAAQRELQEALKATLAGLDTRLQALQALLAEPRSLPPSVQSLVQAASQAVPAITSLLQAGNATEADARLDDTHLRLRHDLGAALRPFHQQLAAELELLAEPLPILRPRDQESLQKNLSTLTGRIEQLSTCLEQSDTDPARLLSATHVLHTGLLRTTTWLATVLQHVLGTTRDAFKALLPKDSPAQRTLATLQPDLSDSDGLRHTKQLRQLAQTLAAQLDEALRSLLPLPWVTEAHRAELLDHLNRKDYLPALAKVLVWKQDAAIQFSEALGPTGSVLHKAAVARTSAPSERGEDIPSAVDLSDLPELGTLAIAPGGSLRSTASAAEPSPAAASRRLNWLKVLQRLLSGLGVTAVGYLLFEAQFIGTQPELITIFFWGFAADISVDSLVAFSKGLPRPSAPPSVLPSVAGSSPPR